jgi:hypothetical protein
MKRTFANTEERRNFDVLNSNEMLQVRGGSDIKPATRDKDIYDVIGNGGN